MSGYRYARRLTSEEKQVHNSGYPYVSTIELAPHATLQPHGHNSNNTHLIVSGSLAVQCLTPSASASQTYTRGMSIPVEAGKCYRATAGSYGATFVEGHKDLSPTTAERFERVGTLRSSATGLGRGNVMYDNEAAQQNCRPGRLADVMRWFAFFVNLGFTILVAWVLLCFSRG